MGTKNDPGAFDCYEHAEPDEPMFVLLARDAVAPWIVREWAARRNRAMRDAAERGEATAAEALAELDQINEAYECALAMEAWREKHRG